MNPDSGGQHSPGKNALVYPHASAKKKAFTKSIRVALASVTNHKTIICNAV